jgi:hypothetical protein
MKSPLLHNILLVSCLALSSVVVFGQTTDSPTEIKKGNFVIQYDRRGISGLATPSDPFGAQMFTRGQRLGLGIKYRTDSGDWRDLAMGATDTDFQETSSRARVVYTGGESNFPLKVTQTFATDGNALDWDIELESTTKSSVEIGDFGISIPVNGPRGEEPKQIFEHGFVRHQFISGNGSFVYFVRASGAGPFLIVTVKPGTRLEYSGGGGGRGGAQVYVHSKASGTADNRGTWRQEHTSLNLGAAGTKTGKARYGFRFHFAKSYDDMRNILFNEGLFDIRVIPGMTIPTDLTARFALHTRAKIDSIKAEFPKDTKITIADKAPRGYHIYEVAFKKLGENMLTIHHDGGRKTYLEFFATEPLETLINKRSSFIMERQMVRDPAKWWNGVFGPYDMKAGKVRTIDDPDIFVDRMVYALTCDDPGLCKAPFVAAKNVSFPNQKEIEGLEYHLEHFVWGKLQRTDKETPYPYGVYGTPHWYINRDPARRKAYAESLANSAAALRDLDKEHVWRSYDYPHIVMLYFHMYEIAKKYPHMSKYMDAAGYLERAYQTARAFFTYPYEIYPSYYETYKWGLYNELIVLNLANVLDREGFPDRAAWLRSEWEKKVKYFVYDDQYPFRSEYAFDRTAFESTYAFAKYGATHDMKPDTNLWHDVKKNKWYSHPNVSKADSRDFMERQLAAGLCVRGWLEASYYQLGADGGVSYMAAMGGWGILDYAVNFAEKPHDWLQLGYSSYLSSWCLVNSGPAENNYGFWFPGKENDGAAGWQFMSSKSGSAWMGSSYPGGVRVPRGPWHYDGEIDLGFGGALRMASTVLADDPIFGSVVYGGKMEEGKRGTERNSRLITPRDGLRQRFVAILNPDSKGSGIRRIKLELDRDGFAKEKPIVVEKDGKKISFTLENRTGDEHTTELSLSLPLGTSWTVIQNGKPVTVVQTGVWDYPLRAALKVTRTPSQIEIAQK